jgi:arylsulfatase A-like enzyme
LLDLPTFMTIARSQCLAPLIVCLSLIGAGCGESIPTWEVLRVGSEGERVELDREVRIALPASGLELIELPEGEDCSLHLGYGMRSKGPTAEFEVALVTADGQRKLLHRGLPPGFGQNWTDVRVEIPSTSGHRLSLSTKPALAKRVVWSRPYLSCRASSRERPLRNVVLVSLDTLRADRIGAYGNPHGMTPNLDGFASQATSFEHAYAHFPNTLGSHASLFTGRYPSQHGLKTSYLNAFGPEVTSLARAFEGSGYATAGFTENAFVSSDFGFGFGFERYHNGPENDPDERFPGRSEATFQRGIEWLEQRPKAPFFLFLHTYDVHQPYMPKGARIEQVMADQGAEYEGRFEKYCGGLVEIAYNARTLELGEEDLRQIERLYDAEVVELDAQVGQLLSELKRLDLDASTLVVLLSDHGEEMNEHGLIGHGESLFDEVMRVPLMFRLPGVVPAAKRVAPRIGLIDVGPTIAELAGIDPPFAPGPQRSRASWILGEPDASEAGPVFAELSKSTSACEGEERGSFRTCAVDLLSIRDAEYTYLHAATTGEEMLFRFPADSAEQHDVAAELPEVAARYRQLADDYRAQMRQSKPATREVDIDPSTRDKLKALGYAE